MDIGKTKRIIESEPIKNPVPDKKPGEWASTCNHDWFDEDGYRICAHCGYGSPEYGFQRDGANT